MKTINDRINELNASIEKATTAIYAVINSFDDIPHEHVGQVVRAKRKDAGMTQDEFSVLVGCSRNYLSQVEKMQCLDAVSFGIVCGIAYALDMNLYELVN